MDKRLFRHTTDFGGTLLREDRRNQLAVARLAAQMGANVRLYTPRGLSTGADLHVDQHLTNVAINYRPQNFIADQIAPIVPVDKESDTYPVFNRMEAFSIEDTTRARASRAKRITRTVGSANYKVKNYALGSDITIEDRANMDTAYRAELDAGATRYLTGKLYLDYERRVILLADTAGSVSTSFVPSSSWAVQGSNAGDPISACFQAMEQMQALVGVRPNSVLWGWKAWNYFKRNTAVRNFIRGTNNGGGVVTRQQAQALFEVDRFNVSEALWHTVNEAYSQNTNATSMQLQNPIADDVIFYYAPMNPSRDDPSWMYAFRWNNPILPQPFVVERHPYDSQTKVEAIEAGYWQDERITGSDYAVKITGVGSAQANGLT